MVYMRRDDMIYLVYRYGAVTFGNNVRNLPANLIQSQDPVVRRMISYRNTKVCLLLGYLLKNEITKSILYILGLV